MIKNILIIILVLLVLGLVSLGATQIYAQNTTGTYQSIVAKLAEKFNLSPNEVKNVFDDFSKEQKTHKQTFQRARLEQMLNDAIKAGKLTETQKKALLNKFSELKIKHDAERSVLEAWAKSNGIDLSNLLMGYKGMKFGHFMHNF